MDFIIDMDFIIKEKDICENDKSRPPEFSAEISAERSNNNEQSTTT